MRILKAMHAVEEIIKRELRFIIENGSLKAEPSLEMKKSFTRG